MLVNSLWLQKIVKTDCYFIYIVLSGSRNFRTLFFSPKKALRSRPQRRLLLRALSQGASSVPSGDSATACTLQNLPQQSPCARDGELFTLGEERPFASYFPIMSLSPHTGLYFSANPRPGPSVCAVDPDNVSPLADIVADEQTLGGWQNLRLPEPPRSQIHWSLKTQRPTTLALCVRQEMGLLV